MKRTFSTLALCAALGLAVTGCQGSQSSSAGAPSSTTAAASPSGQVASAAPSTAATSPTTAPPTTISPTTTTATPPASAAPTDTAVAAATATATALANAGVVSECDDAPPRALSREPSVIVLACADAGIGVQDLTWTSWRASSATGRGVLWENECVPTASCGTNKFSHYPVGVTLSVVKASAEGPWFSQMTVTWKDGRPPNQTPDTFILEGPN